MIRQWYRGLVLDFHPDRGGSHEAMQAINEAHERLRKLAGL
jgi:curved DNA-binding protein CbpA